MISRCAKRTSLGALLALGMSGATAQQVPRLACDEPVHEFGTVEPPAEVRHDFVIRNEGAAPLRLEGVRTSCGCVVGKVDNTTLQPGEELKISTSLPTLGRLGDQRSTILVVSNDPLRRHFPLVLKGAIARVLRLEPEMLVFGSVAPGSPAVERVLHVYNDGAEPLNLAEVAVSSSHYRAEFITVEAGRQWRVNVTFEPPGTPGAYHGEVRLSFDGENARVATAKLSAITGGTLLVAPAEVLVEPEDSSVSRHVIVRSRDNEPFTITCVEHADERMNSHVQPFGPTRYRVRLDGLSAQMADSSPILVHTSLAASPVLEIPVRVTGADAAPTVTP